MKKRFLSIVLIFAIAFSGLNTIVMATENAEYVTTQSEKEIEYVIDRGNVSFPHIDEKNCYVITPGTYRIVPENPIDKYLAYALNPDLSSNNAKRDQTYYSITTGAEISSSENQFGPFMFQPDQYMICEIKDDLRIPATCGLDIMRIERWASVEIKNDSNVSVMLETGNLGIPLYSVNGGKVSYERYDMDKVLVGKGTSELFGLTVEANHYIKLTSAQNIEDEYIMFETVPYAITGFGNGDVIIEDKAIPDMYPGNSYTIKAETTNNLTDKKKKLKWSSSDCDIATVDENGKVCAVTPGEYTITCTNGKDSITLTGKVKEKNLLEDFLKFYTFSFKNMVITNPWDLKFEDFSYYFYDATMAGIFSQGLEFLYLKELEDIKNGEGAAGGTCAGFVHAAALFKMEDTANPPFDRWMPKYYKEGEELVYNLQLSDKSQKGRTLKQEIISLYFLQDAHTYDKYRTEKRVIDVPKNKYDADNIDKMIEILQKENTDGVCINIYKIENGESSGHGLYGYGISPVSQWETDESGNPCTDENGNPVEKNGYAVKIYDCNYPGEERYLYIWPESKEFSYEFIKDNPTTVEYDAKIWKDALAFVTVEEMAELTKQKNIHKNDHVVYTSYTFASGISIIIKNVLNGDEVEVKDIGTIEHLDWISVDCNATVLPNKEDLASYDIRLSPGEYTITPSGEGAMYMSVLSDKGLVSINNDQKASVNINIPQNSDGDTEIAGVKIISEADTNNYSVKYFKTALDVEADSVEFRGCGNLDVETVDEGVKVASNSPITIAAVTGERERIKENLDATQGLDLTAESDGETIVITNSEGDTKNLNVYSRQSCRKPAVDVEKGEYTQPQLVTLTTDTEYADIYYTTDGSDPEENGILYTGPVLINKSCTLQAVAKRYQFKDSSVLKIEYELPVINPPYVSLRSGTHQDGQMCMLDSPYEVYYTLDGTSPMDNGVRYTTPLYISDSATLRAFCVTEEGVISQEISRDYVIEHTMKHEVINAVQNQNNDVLNADNLLETTHIKMRTRTYDEAYESGIAFVTEYDENSNVLAVTTANVTFSQDVETIQFAYQPQSGEKIKSLQIFVWESECMSPIMEKYICIE